MSAVADIMLVPIGRFLPYLAIGWRFIDDIAEPVIGHHGAYSVMLMRPA